jgi:hypothetical protein
MGKFPLELGVMSMGGTAFVRTPAAQTLITCLLGRDDRRSSTRKNYIYLEPNNDLVEALCFGPAIFDRDSAAFDPTQLSQSLRTSRYPLAEGSGCTRDEEADSRKLRRLRTRRKWPCHRATDKRDELASLH